MKPSICLDRQFSIQGTGRLKLDVGSGGQPWGFKSLLPHHSKKLRLSGFGPESLNFLLQQPYNNKGAK
jgi:hypothetical protein